MRRIAELVGRSVSTMGRLLASLGLSSLKALDPVRPIVRYEHESPGEMLHIDTKKLGRIVRASHRVTGDRRNLVSGGWEFAHVAIDDHSRAGFAQMHPDERKGSAIAFLEASVAHYVAHGVRIKRLLTDNGPSHRSKLFNKTCQALGIRRDYTRPYTPQANGKAERFIQTRLLEWASGRLLINSEERTSWLSGFLDHYNHRRAAEPAQLSATSLPPPDLTGTTY